MKKIITIVFVLSLFSSTVSLCTDPVQNQSDETVTAPVVIDKSDVAGEEKSVVPSQKLLDILVSFAQRLSEKECEQKIYDELCALQDAGKITSDEKQKLVPALKLYYPFYREQLKKMKEEGKTRKELAAMLGMLLHKGTITVKQYKSLEKELR